MANERIKLFRVKTVPYAARAEAELEINTFLENVAGEIVDVKLSTWGTADGGSIDRETTVLVIWRPLKVAAADDRCDDVHAPYCRMCSAEQPHETALREMGETFAEIARASADARS